jgi:predicted nucleic acid-binding protein
MIRIMLDSNVHDEVIAVPGFVDRMRVAIATGHIEIVTTHIQKDELARIPDPFKRVATLDVPGTITSTAGAVWGVSRWDQARYGEGTSDIKYTDIFKGNSRDIEDALIAITAASEADVLVTQEKKTLVNRILVAGSKLAVWDFERLRRYIECLEV